MVSMVSMALGLSYEYHLLNVNMNTALNNITIVEGLGTGCLWAEVRIAKENLILIFHDGKFVDNA